MANTNVSMLPKWETNYMDLVLFFILYKDGHLCNHNKMWKNQAWNDIDRSELVSQGDEIILVSSTNYPI